jgi:hypothetical protein
MYEAAALVKVIPEIEILVAREVVEDPVMLMRHLSIGTSNVQVGGIGVPLVAL